MGAAVHRELRRGARHHGNRPGPPPASAGPAGGVGGLHRGPLTGARDLSERPADCRGSIYVPRWPRMGALGWRWPLVLGCAVFVLVGWGVLTWHQAQVWHDSETLWTY